MIIAYAVFCDHRGWGSHFDTKLVAIFLHREDAGCVARLSQNDPEQLWDRFRFRVPNHPVVSYRIEEVVIDG